MGAAVSVIPELEDVIQHGSREKRVADARSASPACSSTAPAITTTTTSDLFDDVFGRLIEEIETKARAELSSHLAPVRNAPVKVLRTLANDDDISVAGPVLTQSPRLADADLVDVANTKGQAHLQAISQRPAIGEAVTDVLVRRGDRAVAHASPTIAAPAFPTPVSPAWSSAPKRMACWPRKSDCGRTFPPHMFRDLLMQATEVVQQRLLASAKPDTAGRNPPRARQGVRRSRRARRAARLSAPRSAPCSACTRPAR